MTAHQGSKLFRSELARDGGGRDVVRLGRWKRSYALLLFCATTAIVSGAQTFNLLVDFDGTNGSHPVGALVEGTDGNLYGTTFYGGIYADGFGTVFKITKSGALTTLHTFCPPQSDCSDGANPSAGLVLANNGSLYGTTPYGGVSSDYGPVDGTVFKIDASGALTTLHTFANTDGALPYSGLVQASNGNLYGETSSGGANGYGTVFKMTLAGAVTTIYNFCAKTNCIDGASPQGTLVQAADGNLYGTAYSGGANNMGTVFRITPGGTLTTLHSFDGADGTHPPDGVVQGTDENLYGTTIQGGTYNSGTVFKITSSGAMTTLYNFCAQANCPDGEILEAGLIQATDGNFYGVASDGGPYLYYGDVFEITPQDTLTPIYSFCSLPNCMDGYAPTSSLVQATDGNFYGVAGSGGTNGDGTVFRIVSGLSPFIELRPPSGKLGAPIVIMGTNFAGVSGVSFNGTAAGFSVISNSEIRTTVPAGATTGSVQVSQASGTVSSNSAFRVKPTVLNFSPASGPVGTSVVISGESLSGTENVVFGGAKTTSFTVNSYTQITATVPARAKTGRITVNTPGGGAESPTSFTITP
jgi:uncharacterized repeat protein (TIGR03803 family)